MKARRDVIPSALGFEVALAGCVGASRTIEAVVCSINVGDALLRSSYPVISTYPGVAKWPLMRGVDLTPRYRFIVETTIADLTAVVLEA